MGCRLRVCDVYFLKINTRGWSNPRNMYMSDYQIPVRRVGTAIVISGNRQERKFEQTVIDRALPSKRWVWKCACSVTARCERWTSLIHHTDTPFTELITPQEQNINTRSGTLKVNPRQWWKDIRDTRGLVCKKIILKYSQHTGRSLFMKKKNNYSFNADNLLTGLIVEFLYHFVTNLQPN